MATREEEVTKFGRGSDSMGLKALVCLAPERASVWLPKALGFLGKGNTMAIVLGGRITLEAWHSRREVFTHLRLGGRKVGDDRGLRSPTEEVLS